MPLPPCSTHKPVASTAPIMTAQSRLSLLQFNARHRQRPPKPPPPSCEWRGRWLGCSSPCNFLSFSRAFAARGHDERCGEEQGGNGRCESWRATISLLLRINLNRFPALFFSSILSAFIPTFDPPPCLLRCARNSTTLAQTTTAAAAKLKGTCTPFLP